MSEKLHVLSTLQRHGFLRQNSCLRKREKYLAIEPILPAREKTVEKDLIDRAELIQQRFVQLRDSL